ncbi:IQ domain-containing protein IQM1 [Brassica napus]|uniref:Calmodulin-binding family protein n=2 Tax=Brassica TaxID=3705 RepID=A0A0D3A2C2_BRAOL|nr:PREDICTED: uncharacterized protein LOC106306877 [Brassica oleracea var. oleracea]XP_013664254.1 IQ domain-containing protein IQM1 [Brassica napus]CAF2068175.1 unnamed protein product [Brassica napus]
MGLEVGSFSRLTSRTSSFKNPTMERSLSFNSWEIPKETKTDSGFETKKSTPNALHGRNCESLQIKKPTVTPPEPFVFFSPRPVTELDAAATTLQKVYKSYRTRRNLADCAVLVEELWWKTLDGATLDLSSVSFFKEEKHEPAASKWTRARKRAAKVGKGLSKDEKAQKLALQHWLEAIDPRHRYGHNLHFYYDVWSASKSSQPFFYWLDIGDGKDVNLEKHPRSVLQKQCITYLGPMEREAYEVIVEDGRLLYKESMSPINSTEESKSIFVLSTTRTLYVGKKKKGVFQHSSFLSGGATTAAGRLVARDGILEAIWPYSGHYLPTEENFKEFISFLEEHNVDLTNVKRCAVNEEYSSSFKSIPDEEEEAKEISQEVEMPSEQEERARPVFDHAKRLSCKWSSGYGPRIGCVRDYPMELQTQALEQVSLSPRVSPANTYGPIPSPRPSPKVRVSPRLSYMGIPSPRAVKC